MIRLFDSHYGKDRIVLAPGEYCSSSENLLLFTVLGSCVAVCLRDPLARIGGMNHYMLPRSLPNSPNDMQPPARIGQVAMELLLDQMLRSGASRGNLVAKVFGGSHVLATGKHSAQLPGANVQFALDYLAQERIPIVAQDTGGRRARKVTFDVASGEAFVEKLAALGREEPGSDPNDSAETPGEGRFGLVSWSNRAPAR